VLTQPLGCAGALVVLVMALAALGADFVAPYDPEAIDFASMLGAPSLDHPLGTDAFGRDVLSRVIFGARTALAIGFLSSSSAARWAPSSASPPPISAAVSTSRCRGSPTSCSPSR